MIRKYRKKPIIVNAIQWTGNNCSDIHRFIANKAEYYLTLDNYSFIIKSLENVLLISRNDWIIQNTQGKFYSCKPDIFEATYELDYNG